MSNVQIIAWIINRGGDIICGFIHAHILLSLFYKALEIILCRFDVFLRSVADFPFDRKESAVTNIVERFQIISKVYFSRSERHFNKGWTGRNFSFFTWSYAVNELPQGSGKVLPSFAWVWTI